MDQPDENKHFVMAHMPPEMAGIIAKASQKQEAAKN
jgi:hypothetical protein